MTTAALCAALAGGVAACGSSSSGSSDQPRIAYFSDSLDNAYLQAGAAAAKETAARAGAKLDVISAGWDATKQLNQVQDAITSGRYDALVVEALDGQTLCKSLTDAAKRMVVSIYNAPICGHYRDLYAPGTVGFFGRDEYTSGMRLAQEMAKALGGRGTVGYVSGPAQVGIVQTTTAGIKDELAKYPDIRLVSQLDGAWDPAKGLAATQDLIQAQPNVDGIIYGVDQMAVPSIAWLRRSGNLKDRKIVTLGGTRQGFALIRDGVIAASINSLPREEAAYAVQGAIDTLRRRAVDVPGWDASRKVYNVLTDPNQAGIVTRDNVDQVKAEWGV